MFSNFLSKSNGKISTKVIATMLVLTLTLANFIFLGKTFLSYALDEKLDEATENENIKFGVYFGERQIKSITKDLNFEEPLKLNAYVRVENGGYLENAVISIDNANFEIIENKDGKIALDNIKAGTQKLETIEIMPTKPETFNLELLNKKSKVRLTGIYNDEQGNKVEINTVKEIEIKWETNSLTNEDVTISQEVITNKILNIGGADKRIIQVQVETGINENKAPVKEEKIELSLPIEGSMPEDTKVMAYSTNGVNGKEGYALSNEEYRINEEQNTLEINVKNEADENGNIVWKKNSEDKFIVTYVYNANINAEKITSNAIVTIDLYGRTEEILSKEDSIEEVNEKNSNLVKIEQQITNKIYKGNMYIGENTEYQTGYDIAVTYHELTGEGIELIDSGEIANKENAKTYFKGITINRDEAVNLLGQDGIIKVYNAENLEKTIAQVTLSQLELSEETEANKTITLNYENEASQIVIKTSSPVNEGRLKIINTKVIKTTGTPEEIKEITSMQTNVVLKIEKQGNIIEQEQIGTLTANLEEPITNAEVNLDKTVLSNEEEINLNLNVGLLNKEEKDKLFKNPKVIIELPQQVNNIEVINKQLVGEEELNISAQTVNINEKQVEIELTGEQTKYNPNGSSLTIDLKLNIEKYICSSLEDIKVRVLNEYIDEEEIVINKQIEIESKTGFIVKNEISQGANNVQNINEEQTNLIINSEDKDSNVKIISSIMNNYKEKLEKVKILGTIESEKGLKLAKGVEAGENVQINYSNEEIESAKTFEIEVGDLEVGHEKSTALELKLPEEIELDGLNTSLKITAMLGSKQVEKELNYTIEKQTKITNTSDKIQAEVEITSGGDIVTEDTVVKEGQMLEYTVKVKNISNETLNNVTIEATKEGGNFWTLVAGAPIDDDIDTFYYDEVEDDKQEKVIEKFEPNEIAEFNYKIIVNKGVKNLLSNTIIKEGEIELLKIQTNNKVTTGDLKVLIVYDATENVESYDNRPMIYKICVNNISEKMLKNVKVIHEIPNVLNNSYYTTISENEDIINNKLEYVIDELKPGETKNITIYSNVKQLDNDFEKINLQAEAIIDSDVYKSNVYTRNVEQITTTINASLKTLNDIKVLKDGEEINYVLDVKNTGKRETNLQIKANTIYGLEVQKIIISKTINGETQKEELQNNIVKYEIDKLSPQEEITMEITAKLNKENLYPKNQESINYKITVTGDYLKDKWIGEVTTSLTQTNTIDPILNTYSISGKVWQDINEDGILTQGEESAPEINVILLDVNGNKLQETKTSKEGVYIFSNLNNGNYMVAFEYDTEKYTATKYKVNTATEETNSNAIQKKTAIGGIEKDVAVTEVINVSNSNVENINLGLVLKPKPNLELNKYINKVTYITNTGTTTYQYNNTNLAKIEIPAKKISGTVLLVEYELNVKNSGNASGYIEDIIDYIPQGMEFSSELNPTWYETKTNTLSNKALSDTEIKAGETKSVKLVLTKTLKSNSTGTIENIGETNKNLSHASLIVSIETGSPYMYIGIVVASFAVISIGIWLINKKIIKVEEE